MKHSMYIAHALIAIAFVATATLLPAALLPKIITTPTHTVHRYAPKKLSALYKKYAFKKINGIYRNKPFSLEITPATLHHIFAFCIQKSVDTSHISGFHHDEHGYLSNQNVFEIFDEQIDPLTDAKKITIRHPDIVTPQKKTLFPDYWSPADCLYAIEKSLQEVSCIQKKHNNKQILQSSYNHMPITHICYEGELITSYPQLITE